MIKKIQAFIQKLSYRTVFVLGLLGCLFGLGLSIGYFQLYLQMPPCTLCQEQRFVLIGMGIVFLLASIHNPKQQTARIYSAALLLLAITGLIISIYQVYWQAQPIATAPVCPAGLNPIIQNIPGSSSIKTVFTGTRDCFKQDSEIFSITIPIWSMAFFFGMMLINAWQMIRTVKRNGNNLESKIAAKK
jgi:disulfide bond formation protein DsbB